MTIADNTPRKAYVATAGQTDFPYTFEILAQTDLKVLKNGATLALSTHYTVSGVGNENGGTVTLVTGAAIGDEIVVYRDMPLSRTTDYQLGARLNPDTLDADLDRVLLGVQQVERDVSRALALSPADLFSPTEDFVLPDTQARISKFLAFDTDGKPVASAGSATAVAGSMIPIDDTAGYYAGANVEQALSEIGTASRTFQSIALLKAATARFGGEVVNVASYYASATPDGGGGLFRWDAASVSADNGGTIIAPDAGGTGRWKRIYSGALNVKWFGAKGDNVADDGAAMQTTIDVASASGNAVYFPSGKFRYSATLIFKNDVTYSGDGKDISADKGTVLVYSGASDAIQINNPINSSTSANINIRDMTVRSETRTAGKACIADIGSTFLSISGVSVSGNDYGIILDQSELTDIDECDIELTAALSTGGIWLVNGSDHTPLASVDFTNRISVKRCQFNGNGGIGVIDDGGVAHAFEDCNFNGCTNHGRFAGVAGLAIRGGEFESATSTNLVFTNTTFNSGAGVGQNVNVEIGGGTVVVPTGGQSAMSFANSSPVFLHSVFLGNTTATKIVGLANIFTFCGINVTNGGGGPTYDGVAQHHTELTQGNFRFPAAQSANPDPNTLDDYEEGLWTPTVTFSTPGDLSVAYATRSAWYTKIGRQVTATFDILTSTFTHTTASGSLQISGLPFQSAIAVPAGALEWGGITKAGFTSVAPVIASGVSIVTFRASGSGVAPTTLTAADLPTGGQVILRGTISFVVS